MQISLAGNVPRRSKTISCQPSVLLKTPFPSFLSARDTVPFERQQEIPGSSERWRMASAEETNHFSTTDCTKNTNILHPSCQETANQSEKMAWTFASTVTSHSHPSRANVHCNQTIEARSSILSQSSQLSSPCAKVGLDSASETDGMTVWEESSTRPETFPSVPLAERKKASLTSIYSSRKRFNTHINKSLPLEDSACQTLPQTDQSRNRFLDAHNSNEDDFLLWKCQDPESFESLQPLKPLSSAKQLKIVPKLQIPQSPTESGISGSSFLEFQSRSHPLGTGAPKAGKPPNQGNGCSPDRLRRNLSGVSRKMIQRVANSPPIGAQHQEGRISKKGESLKPATPASINIQGCDTALRSLQGNVL